MILYFDYYYIWDFFPWASTRTGPRGTKIMGLGSRTLSVALEILPES
jgi:hypothetical protein